MATTLEELLVKVSADSAAFRSDLNKVQVQLGQMQAHAKQTESVFAGLFKFEIVKEAAAKLAEFAKQGLESTVQISLLAEKTGISVEQMSRLSYAAKLSHVDIETLGTAFKRLSVNLAEAITGKGKAAEAFAALKLDPKQYKTADEALAGLAERFSRMPDGINKTAISVALLGKGGDQLIPFLNRGKTGIADLEKEADRLGITLHSETSKEVMAFNEQMIKLHEKSEAASRQLIGGLAPALTMIASKFLDASKNGGLLEKAISGMDAVLRGSLVLVEDLSYHWDILKIGFRSAAEEAVAITRGQWGKVKEIEEQATADERLRLFESQQEIAKIHKEIADEFAGGKAPAIPLPAFTAGTLGGGREKISDLQKLTDELRHQIDVMGMTELETRKFDIAQMSGSKSAKAYATNLADAADRIEGFRKAQDDAKGAVVSFDQQIAAYRDEMALGANATEEMRVKQALANGEWKKQSDVLSAAGISAASYQARLLEAARSTDAYREKQAHAVEVQEETKKIIEESMTPLQKYTAEVERLKKLGLEQSTLDLGIKHARDEYMKAGGEMSSFTKTMTEQMSTAFQENLFKGFDDGLSAMLNSFVATLEKMAAAALTKSILGGIFGLGPEGGAGTNLFNKLGSSLSGLGLPAMASGGSVFAQKPYLVGEQGPEIFVPQSHGSIVPNGGSMHSEVVHTHRFDSQFMDLTLRDALESYLANESGRR